MGLLPLLGTPVKKSSIFGLVLAYFFDVNCVDRQWWPRERPYEKKFKRSRSLKDPAGSPKDIIDSSQSMYTHAILSFPRSFLAVNHHNNKN